MTTVRPLEANELETAARLRLHPDVAPFLGLHAYTSVAAATGALEGRTVIGAFSDQGLVAVASMSTSPRPRRRHLALLDLCCAPDHVDAARDLAVWIVQASARWLQLSKLEAPVDADAPWIPALTAAGFSVEATLRSRRWRGGERRDELSLGWVREGIAVASPAFAPIRPTRPPRRPIVLRPATLSDAEALRDMHHHESVMRGTLQTPIRTLEAWRDRFSSRPNLIVVAAEIDGVLAGRGALFGRPSPAHRTWTLGLVVGAEHQGCGVGSALMTELIRVARRDCGAARLELSVDADNPTARALYDKCGFILEGLERACGWRGDGLSDAHRMALVFD